MMNNEPLITCIIISYNQKKYIQNAIDSVCNQNYSNIELIIADDSSNDFDEMDLYDYVWRKNKNNNITNLLIYSNSKNLGTVKNINTAIRKSRGGFIKIFGADDEIAGCDVFKKQISFLLRETDKVIVTGKSIQCDQEMNEILDKNVTLNNSMINKINQTMDGRIKKKLIKKNYIFPFMTQSMCFRRDFFEKFGLYDESYRLLEDTPMMNRIIDMRIPIGFIDIVVIKHRTEVGISAANVLYSNRSIDYYRDCYTLAYTSLQTSTHITDKITYWHQKRIALYRVSLCESNSKHLDKLFLTLKYLLNIFVYLLMNPVKSIRKLQYHYKRKLSMNGRM